MTLERKVGQVMMIGLDPNGGKAAPELTPGFRALLQELHIGGVVFFERNVESPAQLAKLTADLQEAARANGDPPLFISIDQEGGRVRRGSKSRAASPSSPAPWASRPPATSKTPAASPPR